VLDRAGIDGSWVDFLATVRANLSGHLLPTVNIQGPVDAKVARFVLATRPYNAPKAAGRDLLNVDRIKVDTVFRLLPDHVEFHDSKVESQGTRAGGNVSLYYASDKGISVKGRAESLALTEIRELAGLRLGGQGTGEYNIVGPYSDVRIDASFAVKDAELWDLSLGDIASKLELRGDTLSFLQATGQKGQTAYQAEVALEFGRGDYPHLRANVQAPKGRFEDLVAALHNLHANMAWLDGATGNASASLTLTGALDRFTGDAQATMSDIRFMDRRLGDGGLTMRFVDGKAMRVDRLVLAGPLGKVHAEGTATFDGPLDLRFGGENLSLAELVGAERAERHGVSARMTLSGKLEGAGDNPQLSAYLTAPQVTYAGRALGDAHLEARLDGRNLQVFGRPMGNARTVTKVTLKEPYPFDLSLTLALPELRPLLPQNAAAEVSGSVAGALTAQGNLRALDQASAKARLDKVTLSRGDFSGQNEGPVLLSYAAGRWELQPFAFKGPNTELTGEGVLTDQRLDVGLRGSFDMRLVESFVPFIERSGGRVRLSANANGSWEKPSLVGSAEVTDARFSLKELPVSVRGLSGRVEFSESRVIVQESHGLLNGGAAVVRADVQLDRFKPKHLELGLVMDESNFRPVETLPVTVSGELMLFGKPEALNLAGDLKLLKLRYDQPLAVDALLGKLRSHRDLEEDGATREWLSLDVAVHAGDDVRVDNDLARARLTGDLKLSGTNLRPVVTGAISAAEGSQALYLNHEFNITLGQVEFKDRRAIDPVIELRAETQVREYLVRLHTFGTLANHTAVLTSEPELPQGDIITLLTFGVTSRDQNATGFDAIGLTAAGEALLGYSGLDKQVQRFLPRNAVIRDLSFHMSTVYNEATGTVVPATQLESKLLTDKLKLAVTKPVSADWGNKGTWAQVEYRFHNRLSLQAQWDNANTPDAASSQNLGFGLKYRWELE
jgi:translocation and assembly module TamB